tara:strand:- start:4064 stop:4675 length:612 start_codon:yes stop_codon:yes gene_type:complete
MISGRLPFGLALTCCVGLFSVSCLTKKTEAVSEGAVPSPAAYPSSPSGYSGGPTAQNDYTTVTPAAPPAPQPFELREGEQLVAHQIQTGESLSSIAGKYSANISRIQSANGISGTTIYAGKTIQVPTTVSPQLVMNNGNSAGTGTYQSAPPAPATGGYNTPVYPGATATPPSVSGNPASTSYPRVETPPAPPAGAFPTPSFSN